MIDFDKSFEAGKIILRPMKFNDYREFTQITGDSQEWIYFTNDLSDKEVLKTWINTAVEENLRKTRLALVTIDKQNQQIIGSTSLGNISDRDKRIEIGWTWIAKDYRGKGINTQAKFLLLRYCFEALNYKRVEFKTDVLNIPARKALLKIGAKEEGILRSHTLMTGDRRRDTIYYSILYDEWQKIKIKLSEL